MRSQRNRERQGAGLALIAALLLASFLFCTPPAGLKLHIDGGSVSVVMKLAFVEMSFDFGQSRSKSNSAVVVL